MTVRRAPGKQLACQFLGCAHVLSSHVGSRAQAGVVRSTRGAPGEDPRDSHYTYRQCRGPHISARMTQRTETGKVTQRVLPNRTAGRFGRARQMVTDVRRIWQTRK